MKRFELTEDHIKLLSRMYVGWDDCEFGAPEVDPKRPYGNSDVHGDMLKILGWEPKYVITIGSREYPIDETDCYFNVPQEIQDILDNLHKETHTALQIVLVTKSFTPGIYECKDYTEDWRLVDGTK